MRSYQAALSSAQQQLGVRAPVAATAGADMPNTRGREKGAGKALREMLEQQGAVDGNAQLLVQGLAPMLEALENLTHGRGAKEPDTLEDLLFGTLGREEDDVGRLGAMAKGSANLTRSMACFGGAQPRDVHRSLQFASGQVFGGRYYRHSLVSSAVRLDEDKLSSDGNTRTLLSHAGVFARALDA
eukprot:2917846-Amphidinium_carterae.3